MRGIPPVNGSSLPSKSTTKTVSFFRLAGMWEKTASKQERTKSMAMKRMRTKTGGERRGLLEDYPPCAPQGGNYTQIDDIGIQPYRLSPKA